MPATKLKRPSEWVVGMVRATGITQTDPVRYTGGQALLGEPLWRPGSPKGFPDDEASWVDGMGRRLDVANNFAERVADTADPLDIIESVLASTGWVLEGPRGAATTLNLNPSTLRSRMKRLGIQRPQ